MDSEQLAGSGRDQHPTSSLEAAVAPVQQPQAPPLTRHKALIGLGGFSPLDSTLNPEVELMHSQSQLAVGVSERKNHLMEQWKNLIHAPPLASNPSATMKQRASWQTWITGYEHYCLTQHNSGSTSFAWNTFQTSSFQKLANSIIKKRKSECFLHIPADSRWSCLLPTTAVGP